MAAEERQRSGPPGTLGARFDAAALSDALASLEGEAHCFFRNYMFIWQRTPDEIFVADDDALSRTLLERLSSALDEVTAIDNGRSAAEHLCCHDGPRLALLDWVMPELDGHADFRGVRRKLNSPMFTCSCSRPKSRSRTLWRGWLRERATIW